MKKRSFSPVEGVSNIELFYDLIFVYCISVLTSTMHHVEGGFFSLGQWLEFAFYYFAVLQVWFFTTFLLNRYGDRSASDNVCLFVNMFLLYFMANGILEGLADSTLLFSVPWALVLANIFVHWLLKRLRYDNLDDDDKRIMDTMMAILGIEIVLVVISTLMPPELGAVMSWVALVFGVSVFTQAKSYRAKPARFSHLAERCSLITIIAFGETIVVIATYMTGLNAWWFSALVFALVVGLFLIYIYEHDQMLDHHADTDGMMYMTLTGWIIFIVGNITVALEYMPMESIAFIPKSTYLTGGLVLYLLTSFLIGRYNKPEFTYSRSYAIGRLGACALIIVVALVTNFDPALNLACDVIAVYFALWHEWLLFHSRTNLLAFGKSLGYSREQLEEAGYTFGTREGRRAIAKAAREIHEQSADDEKAT